MIPRAPLLLGLLGLVPLLWGAATLFSGGLAEWGVRTLGTRFVAPFALLSWGQILLAFMSGVLWGFSTKMHGSRAATGYVLSVIPALWAFVMVGAGPVSSAIHLIAGFVGLAALNWSFWRQNLAPEWWMRFSLIQTVIAVVCLAILVI